jgi:hypothetical protein
MRTSLLILAPKTWQESSSKNTQVFWRDWARAHCHPTVRPLVARDETIRPSRPADRQRFASFRHEDVVTPCGTFCCSPPSLPSHRDNRRGDERPMNAIARGAALVLLLGWHGRWCSKRSVPKGHFQRTAILVACSGQDGSNKRHWRQRGAPLPPPWDIEKDEMVRGGAHYERSPGAPRARMMMQLVRM